MELSLISTNCFSGLLPVHAEGEIASFAFFSWRTALSIVIWGVFPAILLIYEYLPTINLIYGGRRDPLLFLSLFLGALNVANLLASPILQANFITAAGISLFTIKLLYKKYILFGSLNLFGGSVWIPVAVYIGSNSDFVKLAVSLITIAILNVRVVSQLLLYDAAVNWILQDSENMQKATTGNELVTFYSRIIEKYRSHKLSSGSLLFTLTTFFGLNIIIIAYITFFMTKYAAIISFAYGMMTIGQTFNLYVLANLADDAYEGLFTFEAKLR